VTSALLCHFLLLDTGPNNSSGPLAFADSIPINVSINCIA
jgi:hypothetical protein